MGDNIVRALQSETAVVTYRAMVGFFITIILGLVAYTGNRIIEGQVRLEQAIFKTMISVERNTGRLDDHTGRLSQVENEVGALDHRVTVIEARQRMK